MKALWLPDVLRKANLRVVETDGWQDRGKEFKEILGVVAHHTGSGTENGLVNMIINGRSDLPGPLSQLFLGRDGTYHVIAAGKSNHAGKGNWQGVTEGNSHFIGIEAHNDGTGGDPWPTNQMDAYIRGVAAILQHLDRDSVWVCGHKEYALPRGRKVDPTFDMFQFRLSVEQIMENPAFPTIQLPTQPPLRSMLHKGSMGNSVKQLQTALNKHGAKLKADGNFGPATLAAVKKFQEKSKLTVDGVVGPKTWAALGVK